MKVNGESWKFFATRTAKRIIERLGIQTSSSFVYIPNIKANFLFVSGIYMACFFYLETIGVN